MSGKKLALGGALLVSLPLLGSCIVEDDGVFLISQNQPIDSSGEGCQASVTKSTTANNEGILDVWLDRPQPYYMFPFVENRLQDLDSNDKIGNTIKVDFAHIVVRPYLPPMGARIQFPDFCPLAFDQFKSFILEAGGTFAAWEIPVLLPCHAEAIKAAFENTDPLKATYNNDVRERIFFTVEVRMVGRRGGSTIKSDVFRMPIRVCYGCLQVGTLETGMPSTPYCSLVGTNAYKGNSCNFAQDGPLFQCCYDDTMNNLLECPARDRKKM